MRSHHFNRMTNLEQKITREFYQDKVENGTSEEFEAIKPGKSQVTYTVFEDQAKYDPAIGIIRERERIEKLQS